MKTASLKYASPASGGTEPGGSADSAVPVVAAVVLAVVGGGSVAGADEACVSDAREEPGAVSSLSPLILDQRLPVFPPKHRFAHDRPSLFADSMIRMPQLLKKFKDNVFPLWAISSLSIQDYRIPQIPGKNKKGMQNPPLPVYRRRICRLFPIEEPRVNGFRLPKKHF